MGFLVKLAIVATSALWFSWAVGQSLVCYKSWNMKNYVVTHGGF